MLLLRAVGLLLNVYCDTWKVRLLLVSTLLVASLHHFMVFLMLIGHRVLMIINILVDTFSFLAPLPFHGNLASNALLLAPPLKQSIRLWLMVLLRFFGFAIFYQIYAFLLVLLPLFGATIWVLLICLPIQFFMLVQNMLKLIITLFMIEWLKRRLRFASSPPKTN
jgi:hypothetical protein